MHANDVYIYINVISISDLLIFLSMPYQCHFILVTFSSKYYINIVTMSYQCCFDNISLSFFFSSSLTLISISYRYLKNTYFVEIRDVKNCFFAFVFLYERLLLCFCLFVFCLICFIIVFFINFLL